MSTINITEAKTADLVAFYNLNIVRFPDGTVIKKFADRKTAEKRVADLVEKIASHFPDEETPEGTIPNPDGDVEMDAAAEALENEGGSQEGATTTNLSEMPLDANGMVADGAPEEQEEDPEVAANRAAKSHSAFNVLQTTLAALNEANERAKSEGTKPVVKSSSSKASNSDGVAASWVDSDIRAARLTRDGVEVNLDGNSVGIFKSTREAFRALRLPDNKHIRFRLKLKESHRDQGEGATFEHNGKKYVFTIVQVAE
jgi:hypothetical protein